MIGFSSTVTMKCFFRVVALLALALSACAQRPIALAPTATPLVPQYCQLRVDGGTVKDNSGQVVVLHGATLPTLTEMQASDRKPDQRLRALADAGARVVRLTIDERDMTPTFVPAQVSPFIDQANALGILVILSYRNNPALSINGQADNAEDWLRLALQYLRNAPGVWFEPFQFPIDSPKYQGVAQRMIDVANGYRVNNVLVIGNPVWLKDGTNVQGITGRTVAHSVASLDGWPASATPLLVISNDEGALSAAASSGAWAIAGSDEVTNAKSAIWKLSKTC